MTAETVEAQHGPDCTCPVVTRIETVLVAVADGCPGDRNPHRGAQVVARLNAEPKSYPGRVVITWPARLPGPDGLLWSYRMRVHDDDTGQEITSITGMRMVLGDENWTGDPILVDLTMLVDANGVPEAPGRPVVSDGNGSIRSAVFRAYVAEMRVEQPDPTIPTRESVNRGEHTVNQYRKHHGITDTYPVGGTRDPEGVHRHLFAHNMTGACDCGMTAKQYQQLFADETIGLIHASETTKPIDRYGRAVEAPVEQ